MENSNATSIHKHLRQNSESRHTRSCGFVAEEARAPGVILRCKVQKDLVGTGFDNPPRGEGDKHLKTQGRGPRLPGVEVAGAHCQPWFPDCLPSRFLINFILRSVNFPNFFSLSGYSPNFLANFFHDDCCTPPSPRCRFLSQRPQLLPTDGSSPQGGHPNGLFLA